MLVTFLKKKPTLPKTYLKAFMKSISKNLTFKKPFLQKRKKKENVNEHSQRDNHHSTNPRFTYRFHFQEKQPFLQKRKRKNGNERSQRKPPPYQPKIYLPVLFLRESGSLQVQEIHSYKKEY